MSTPTFIKDIDGFGHLLILPIRYTSDSHDAFTYVKKACENCQAQESMDRVMEYFIKYH